ncbi:MAG: hypothetical protein IT306_22400 [Chloroflexi bacterium]|nr:hypothetical protein [Chloroflexota bacterium]
MIRPPARLLSILALVVGLTGLPVPGATAEAFQSPTTAAGTDGPARCHLIGRATKPAERLSSTQFAVTLAVERDLRLPPGTDPSAAQSDATILVNSTYGATFYRPFDVKTGTPLEVAGYVRAGGQCVVDTLNVGTLAPGYEGYIRPPAVCPTAGDETISVYEQASVPLGCGVAPMFTAPTAVQRFEHGLMLHLKGIYVLQYGPAALNGTPLDGGPWAGARDAWREPEPPSGGLQPPAGLFEPLRGFGKAWREQAGGPEGGLGWAVEEEATADASWQLFEKGIVIVTRAGEGLILYHEGRVWELKAR